MVTLQILMGWFQKHLHIKTTSVFLILFPSWFPSPAPSLSHALTHSAWILAGTASAVKAAAVATPPPRLILRSANEPCRLILYSAVYLTNRFCGLWVSIELINPRSRWRLVIRFKFHTCGSKEVRILAFRVDPPPFRFVCESYIKLPLEQARIFSCWCLPANDFSPSVINHVSIF